jgi:hypothetical protein
VSRSKTSLTGDAQQVRALLSWSRANGVDLTRVTVGACTVDVAPRSPALPRQRQTPTVRASIYNEFGGDVLREAVERGEVDGEDYQPVVGRQ